MLRKMRPLTEIETPAFQRKDSGGTGINEHQAVFQVMHMNNRKVNAKDFREQKTA